MDAARGARNRVVPVAVATVLLMVVTSGAAAGRTLPPDPGTGTDAGATAPATVEPTPLASPTGKAPGTDEPAAPTPGPTVTPDASPEPTSEVPVPVDEGASTVPRDPAVVSLPVDAADLAGGELLREGTVFQLVAVTWDNPRARASVEVSAREGGRWSEWVTLAADEHGDGRGGTEPLTTGGAADGVRLRVAPGTSLPAGARLELVDPGDPGEPAQAPMARIASAAVSTAPAIISRAQWGADESINTHTPSPARYLEMAFVHHTATTNDYGPGDSAAQVRSIYLYHAQGRDWGDIGYNFIVDRYGQVFEGRSGGIEVPEIGAHAGSGFNTGSVGVAALGTFDTSVPDAVTERIAEVIAWKFALHQIDPSATVARTSGGAGNVRWGEGTRVWLPAISGHRETSFTSCPGEALNAQLPAVRARVAALLAAASPGSWLSGTLDGLRVDRDKVTAFGWVAGLEPGATNLWVRARTWGRTASAPVGLARPDVQAVYPAFGPRSGFEATLSLPSGSYQVCLDVFVPGRPMVTLGCGWATVSVGRILGNFEAATPQRSAVRVQGWVLQQGTGRSNDVHVYVDGRWGGSFAATGVRPDVGAAYPSEGSAHGFDAVVSVPGGRHEVCVYAISTVASVGNPLLRCRTVDVPSGTPTGYLEAVVDEGLTAGLRGWTFDPDTPDPVEVHVYTDGAWAGRFLADGTRPDVQRAYGLANAAHGIAASVPLPLGQHQVCAYAINVGPGTTNPSLGCRAVGVPLGMPFGSLDVVTREASGAIRVKGWLIDPDTRGAVSVHVYVGGRWGGAAVADTRRPDLVAPYPGFGADHGYDVTLPAPAGPTTVCVYGINVGVGATNPLVACRTVA